MGHICMGMYYIIHTHMFSQYCIMLYEILFIYDIHTYYITVLSIMKEHTSIGRKHKDGMHAWFWSWLCSMIFAGKNSSVLQRMESRVEDASDIPMLEDTSSSPVESSQAALLVVTDIDNSERYCILSVDVFERYSTRKMLSTWLFVSALQVVSHGLLFYLFM